METLTPAAPAINGHDPEPTQADAFAVADVVIARLTARQLLDRAKDAADASSPDGLYTLAIPSWGADVTLRALTFAEITRLQIANGAGTDAADPVKAVRDSLALSLVDPVFSRKEVDELMDDPAQVDAALLLTRATEAINKLGQRGQASAALSFRPRAR